ncbi:MAG: endonuclease/exonuclease/phosphatase family protein [Aeromicrobium sp.]
MRRAVLGLITLFALCFAGLGPADAASRPSGVGLVSYSAATRSTLTVGWHTASRATSYQVFVSASLSGLDRARVYGTTKSTHFTARGLRSGYNYFIQVRAMNGSTAGSKSSKVGHRTIRSPQGAATGPKYDLMSYNLCTRACMDVYKPTQSGYYTYWKWSQRMPAAMERINVFKPDVVALQESECGLLSYPDLHWEHPEWRPVVEPPAGYAKITCRSAKQLFYDDTRFDLAPGEECMDNDETPPPTASCTHGSIYLGNHGGGKRFAVWAELVDKTAADKHVIFASVHLVTGSTAQADNLRERELNTLFIRMGYINPEKVPVVYLGDFNSHKGRKYDSVTAMFKGKGYYDAFDLAMALKFQHYNTYNDFESTPNLGITWGDHVDHVWVDSTKVRVNSWRNAAKFDGSRYAHPIPSDHNPLVVSIQVN